jgi:peptidylprolyl isomerase
VWSTVHSRDRTPFATVFGVAAILAALLAFLTGCSRQVPQAARTSAGSTVTIAQISVSGDAGKKPKVTVPAPLAVTKTERKVLITGTGPKAAAGQRVTINYVGINGADGKEFDTSYGQRPTSFVLDPKSNLKGLVDGLIGTPAGSRVLLAVPPRDGYGLDGRPAAGIGPTDTIVLVVDLTAVKTVLTKASGAPVAAKAGLPTVKRDRTGRPTISLPPSAAPSGLVSQLLIRGTGTKVARGQQITVHYTGMIWPGGKQFDSSWARKQPSTFTIGAGKVIAGWDRGLVGQPIGSQVLLIIPPDDGYGAEGRPDAEISGTDTLVFVVDILDAG